MSENEGKKKYIKEINVAVYVNGKLSYSRKIPCRYPVIKAAIVDIVKHPEKVKAGVNADVIIKAQDKGSESESVLYRVCLDPASRNDCVRKVVKRGTSFEARFACGPGNHEAVLYSLTGVIDRKEFTIGKLPLDINVDLRDDEASKITYPDGGTLLFDVIERDGVPFSVVDVNAGALSPLYLLISSTHVRESDHHYTVKVNVGALRKAIKDIRLKLIVRVKDVEGEESVVTKDFDVKVVPSETYLKSVNDRISELKSKAFELRMRDPVGALVFVADALSVCGEVSVYVDCVDGLVGAARGVLSGLPVGRAVEVLEGALEKARQKYGDDSLPSTKIRELLREFNGKVSEVISSVKEKLSKYEELINSGKLKEATQVAVAAEKICSDADLSPEKYSVCAKALEAVRHVNELRQRVNESLSKINALVGEANKLKASDPVGALVFVADALSVCGEVSVYVDCVDGLVGAARGVLSGLPVGRAVEVLEGALEKARQKYGDDSLPSTKIRELLRERRNELSNILSAVREYVSECNAALAAGDIGSSKNYVNKALELCQGIGLPLDKVEVCATASELLNKVRETEERVNEVSKEIDTLLKSAENLINAGEPAKAIAAIVDALTKCNDMVPFMKCGEIKTRLSNTISKYPNPQAALILEDALSYANDKTVKTLKALYENYVPYLNELKRKVVVSLSKYEELLEKKKLRDASKAAEKAYSMCTDAGIKGKYLSRVSECVKAQEAITRIRRYEEFLNTGIVVTIPPKTRLKWFKMTVKARNKLDENIEGAYIDFSPAKDYLELPTEKLVLPPLYPGMEIAREVKVTSLYVGNNIVIPYKVCLSDLCVEKRGRIAVGILETGGAEGIKEADILVGRSVAGLESLQITPRPAQNLPREITVSEYKCTYMLGSGGFSVTLLCTKLGMNTVLKVPHEAYIRLISGVEVTQKTLDLKDEVLKAFDKEARILHELRHPNIVKLMKYSLEPFPYLAFEYCELGDLRRVLSATPRLKPKVALEIMIPITAAVAHAHAREKPIVHMDIKPENILLTRDYVPKLTDFNIAKILSTVSRTSAGKGYTQGYAAPEQLGLEGYPPPHTYTDVFALGVVLYELITGVRPYPIETYQNNFRNPPKPKPPSQLNPETPRDLDDILEITLRPNPDDRYRDATQLLKDLWDTYQQHYYG